AQGGSRGAPGREAGGGGSSRHGTVGRSVRREDEGAAGAHRAPRRGGGGRALPPGPAELRARGAGDARRADGADVPATPAGPAAGAHPVGDGPRPAAELKIVSPARLHARGTTPLARASPALHRGENVTRCLTPRRSGPADAQSWTADCPCR